MPNEVECVPCDELKRRRRAVTHAPRQTSFAKGRLMPDGSIIYPKKGFEPPPPIEGYNRDPGNAWRFIPLWPACKFLNRTLQLKRCGSYNIKMTCGCADCPLLGQILKIEDCQSCPLRQE